jgi:hypothetical protein
MNLIGLRLSKHQIVFVEAVWLESRSVMNFLTYSFYSFCPIVTFLVMAELLHRRDLIINPSIN